MASSTSAWPELAASVRRARRRRRPRRQRHGRPARARGLSGGRGGPRRLPARQGLLRVHEPRGGPPARPARRRRRRSRPRARRRSEGTAVTAARRQPAPRADSRGPAPSPFRPTGLSVSRRILDHALVDAPRAAPARRCSSAPRSRSCCTTAAPWPARWCATPTGARRTRPGPAHGRRRRASLGRGPAARTAPPRASPPHRLRGPRGRRRRHGRLGRDARRPARATSDSTRSAAGAPTWRWWCPRPAAPRRGAGSRRFFLERAAALSRPARAGGGRLAVAGRCWRPGRSPPGRAGSSADGAALVGDAADFFDPFTGEGIYSALRGAELLAETAAAALARAGTGHRGAARALPARAAAGVRRQVGGRAADRLRHAVPRPVRPRGRRGWAGGPAWRTPSSA